MPLRKLANHQCLGPWAGRVLDRDVNDFELHLNSPSTELKLNAIQNSSGVAPSIIGCNGLPSNNTRWSSVAFDWECKSHFDEYM
eukprot:2671027-Lingulodinium_polyedra.AAC.1